MMDGHSVTFYRVKSCLLTVSVQTWKIFYHKQSEMYRKNTIHRLGIIIITVIKDLYQLGVLISLFKVF